MEVHMSPYMAALVALAVLLWPAGLYLWLRWYVEKHYGPLGGEPPSSAVTDRRSGLKQARRLLRRRIG